MTEKILKKNIIFHLGHPGFLAKYLVYWLYNHKNDRCIFLADCTFASPETKKFLKNWNKNNESIGKMLIYNDSKFWNCTDEKDVSTNIIDNFDEIFKQIGTPINDFDDVYSAFDGLNGFGVYCSLKKKRYHVISVNGCAFNEDLEQIHYDNTRVKYVDSAVHYLNILKKFRAVSAYSNYVEDVMCIGEYPKNYPKCIPFEYEEKIMEMSATEFDIINSAYHATFEKINDGYMIPLRSYSSVKYSGQKYSEKQNQCQRLLQPYRRLLDYFINDDCRVFLKAHPNYELNKEAISSFPNSIYIPGYYPFEYLLKQTNAIKYVSIGGSSSKFIKGDSLILPESFFGHSDYIDQIVGCIKISQVLNNEVIVIDDCHLNRQYRALIDKMLLTKKQKSIQKTLTIIADGRKQSKEHIDSLYNQLKDGDLLLVINPSNDSSIEKNSVLYCCEEIPDNNYKEEIIGYLRKTNILLVSNNLNIIKKAETIDISKKMYRCGTIMQITVVNTITADVNTKIKDEKTDAFITIARKYRDGKGVPQDLNLAADWMRKAAAKNVGWAKNELFDILWKIGTPEAYGEMVSVAQSFADSGDGFAMGRLGRAYRDGKGVPQDLNLAADWMRKAAAKNVGWANKELKSLSTAR